MWCWEKTLESPLDSTKIKTVNPKVNHPLIFIGRTDAEAGALILWPPDGKSQLTGKDPDAGKDWSQRKKGAAEDEMVRQHHQLNGHEFEQIPGDSGGQRSLTCSSMRSQRVECYLVTEQQQIIQMVWLQCFLRSQTWASPPLLASSHWHYQDLESPRIYPARQIPPQETRVPRMASLIEVTLRESLSCLEQVARLWFPSHWSVITGHMLKLGPMELPLWWEVEDWEMGAPWKGDQIDEQHHSQAMQSRMGPQKDPQIPIAHHEEERSLHTQFWNV